MNHHLPRNGRRVKLPFTSGLEVEFVDRDRGIKQVYEFGEKGTRFPIVVFGPEGCGKTAWLRQSVEVLRDLDYDVIYINPLRKEFLAEVGVRDLRDLITQIAKDIVLEHVVLRVVWGVITLAREAIRLGRSKLAVIVDDAFQLIGVKESAFLVKSLLELIEHPPTSYDRVVVLVATSEGLSREEIGRHRWAWLKPMWNMCREGFKELYNKIPEPKPNFEDVWRWTGGNPSILSQLYQAGWDVSVVIDNIVRERKLRRHVESLDEVERKWLEEAVEDPDSLFIRERLPLMSRLVELNMIVDSIEGREGWYWIDEPPPEKDLELGIGRYVAWQTPIHKEAIKKVLVEMR